MPQRLATTVNLVVDPQRIHLLPAASDAQRLRTLGPISAAHAGRRSSSPSRCCCRWWCCRLRLYDLGRRPPDRFSGAGRRACWATAFTGRRSATRSAFRLLATLIATVLGTALGWLFGRTDLPRASLFEQLATLPIFIPPFVGAVAWTLLSAPRIGAFNVALRDLGLPELLDVYTQGGMAWVIGIYLAPYVMMMVAGALRVMDPSLEEAARVGGLNSWRTAARITLPLDRAGDSVRRGARLHHRNRPVRHAGGAGLGEADPAPHLAHLDCGAGGAARLRRDGHPRDLSDCAVAYRQRPAALAAGRPLVRHRHRQGFPAERHQALGRTRGRMPCRWSCSISC